MLPFRLQLEDGLPVSEQLVRAAKRAILGGELEGGEIFPSVRMVAQELRVSPTTVHKAVLELKESGYVVSRPGVGMVVVGREKLGKAALKEQLRARCEELWKEANFLGLGAKELGELLREIEQEKGKNDE
ncbi:GntR family transcriptional regulator [Akkermansiaceae bacterium]|jgi:DNA-binding transcriptional regulator YhcF (GntR family)|nr:GntR family transcriptional regulator [Akkermansiaceae bacterium]